MAREWQMYPTFEKVQTPYGFVDLAVTDSAFEVGLSFKGVPEKLHVPLRAITSFVDPHASFALKFDTAADTAEAAVPEADARAETATAVSPPVEPVKKRGGKKQVGKTPATEPGKAAVVSLDAFRKKNG